MKIITADDPDIIKAAVETLKNSGLVIFPTETCYGIAVDATNQKAVSKLIRYKSRMQGKPISIAVADRKMAEKYANINEVADNLYKNYLPGPITVVSKSKNNLAKGIESEFETIGIRIPAYQLIIKIIKEFGKPITATSANVSYEKQPYSVKALLNSLSEAKKNQLDLIIDAGKLPHNEASTVVDTTMNSLNVLRRGKIEFNQKGKEILSGQTDTAKETENFGAMLLLKFINELKSKAIILTLGGDLGTGKTQFTKGIARQLGISQIIKSPTFNIINEYKYDQEDISGKLIHIDTWRLGDENELKALNLKAFGIKGNVIVIEWADKFFSDLKDIFKQSQSLLLKIKIEYDLENLNKRQISVEML
ncbi:threonylcarbamoyl-AMP synthase [Candidatus Dojkabacteria bacterium]|nr:threonylcarbamoyl-AMP synthase [Candidatus Dojkabacteria bacterium]